MSSVRNAVCKQHQIRTRKSGAWYQQTVKLEEVSGGSDRLRWAIFERLIPSDVNAQISQLVHLDEAQCTFCPDSQNMYLVLNEAGPYRFERKSEPHFS